MQKLLVEDHDASVGGNKGTLVHLVAACTSDGDLSHRRARLGVALGTGCPHPLEWKSLVS